MSGLCQEMGRNGGRQYEEEEAGQRPKQYCHVERVQSRGQKQQARADGTRLGGGVHAGVEIGKAHDADCRQ
ncbi:hypothetical protein D3C72_2230870 [compost metagenome]